MVEDQKEEWPGNFFPESSISRGVKESLEKLPSKTSDLQQPYDCCVSHSFSCIQNFDYVLCICSTTANWLYVAGSLGH